MAFRIPVGNLVVEADTAGDVRQLLGELGLSSPRMLPAAAPTAAPTLDEIVIEAPPRRASRSRATSGRRTEGKEPSVDYNTSAAAARAATLGATCMAALQAHGPQSTTALAHRVGSTAYLVLKALKPCAEKGLAHTEGVGNQTQWHLGAAIRGRRRTPAKEEPSRSR